MISKPGRHCTVELQALPSRIGQVRRIVSAQLRYWHLDPLIDSAALGVTELLTNVHRHAQPDTQCRVEIDLSRDTLTVSVRDNDPRVPGLGDLTDVTAIGGRGLALVASVSEDWGVRPHDGGKEVWFTLQVPAPAVPQAAVAPTVPVTAFPPLDVRPEPIDVRPRPLDVQPERLGVRPVLSPAAAAAPSAAPAPAPAAAAAHGPVDPVAPLAAGRDMAPERAGTRSAVAG